MGNRSTIAVVCLYACFTLAGCTSAAMSERESIRENQRRAEPVIASIDQYASVQGRNPATVNDLVPDYLDSLPVTVDGSDFAYYQDDIAVYLLCFDVPQRYKFGCCYSKKLLRWDCGAGD